MFVRMNAIFNTCGVILHEGRIGGFFAAFPLKGEPAIKLRNLLHGSLLLVVIITCKYTNTIEFSLPVHTHC